MSKIIGRFEPFKSCHEAFDVASMESSNFMNAPGYIGKKADGYPFHVFTEHWKWVPCWTGEGLPPVGSRATIVDSDPHECYRDHVGVDVEILAHTISGNDHPAAVYKAIIHGEVFYHALIADRFRPIRTPEQIAADKREKDAEELFLTINWNDSASTWANLSRGRREDYFKAIDAGYRKFEIVDEPT